MRRWGLIGLLLLAVVPVQSQDYLKISGIPYVPGSTSGQALDVALPEGESGPFPTVLLFHGSGGSTGQVLPQSEHWVRQGFATVSVTYRETGSTADTIADAFCALAWVHTQADVYGFDATRLAAFGYSLGGQMAAMLALVNDGREFLQDDCPHTLPEDSRVQAVITYAGAVLTPEAALQRFPLTRADRALLEQLAELPVAAWSQARVREVSPVLRLLPYQPLYWLDDTDSAPFLLIHSADDAVLPAQISQLFARRLVRESQIETEVIILPAGNHRLRLFNDPLTAAADAVVDALLSRVRAR
jgi:acetyl esterase/lipase